jgi:hypothetical protein
MANEFTWDDLSKIYKEEIVMFQNCSMPGMDFAFPDTCVTPGVIAGAPGPIPYPNLAIHAMAVPSQVKVLIMCMPAHNIATIIPATNGDQAWCSPGGVASGIMMGPTTKTRCSVKVLEGGLPVTRMLDNDVQNLTNAPTGMSLVPGQFKVLTLT